MAQKLWYAVLFDNDDNDWGIGYFNRERAIQHAKYLRDSGYPDAFVAVIDVTWDDASSQICAEEIRDI